MKITKITIINILVIISTIAFASYSNAAIQVKRKLDINFAHIKINPSVAAPDANSGTQTVTPEQRCINDLSDQYGDSRFGDTEQNFIDFCDNAFYVETNFNELCLEAAANLAANRANFLYPIAFGGYDCSDKSFTYNYTDYRNNYSSMLNFIDETLTSDLLIAINAEFYNVVMSRSEYQIYR